MPKLKTLSGPDIIKILKKFNFEIERQKGSHIKLMRVVSNGVDDAEQKLTVPNHRELDKGTVKAIYNQSLKYISESELKKYFYFE